MTSEFMDQENNPIWQGVFWLILIAGIAAVLVVNLVVAKDAPRCSYSETQQVTGYIQEGSTEIPVIEAKFIEECNY